MANHGIQRMRASLSVQSQLLRPWRLAPTADGDRSASFPQAPMKHIIILPVLVCIALLCGCASAYHRVPGEAGGGTLAVRLTSLLGMEGSERGARIYLDGHFVGNYEPDETVLALPAGKHVVTLEIPRVYSRRSLPNGNTEIRSYTLKGEERIEVLGGGSKQSLVFNAENLKSREISDEDGH